MGQYFENDSSLVSERKIIKYFINGRELSFFSDNGVFSKDYIDFGSSLLIKTVLKENLKGEGIDLGCGIGVVGVTISLFNSDVKFDYFDVNDRALELTKLNKEKYSIEGIVKHNNGLENVPKFSREFVITNPPIRAGKSVYYKFYEDAHEVLKDNGSLYIVIQKKQGAESTKSKLLEVFGNCEVLDKDKGYFIFKSTKK